MGERTIQNASFLYKRHKLLNIVCMSGCPAGIFHPAVHFPDEENEAQRGLVTYSRVHSELIPEPDLRAGPPAKDASAFHSSFSSTGRLHESQKGRVKGCRPGF